ncbi:phage tail protein [Primorskyibacter sp. 2E107]|uniref:phage tail protein n=1 Tax=Primorskyibacter sp. 2E107 TaxID=3403458 RepID=UPI003AF977FA
MTDGDEEQGAAWPLPKFSFQVSMPGVGNMPFQEVTGLEIDAEVLDYRSGNSAAFSAIKMPGVTRTGTVVMKNGIFASNNTFWSWFSQIRMNTIQPATVTISLLDESGKPTMVWKLANAWPTKISGTDLKSDGNEVAVETIEFAHEGLTIANG